MGGSYIETVGIPHMECDGAGDQILLHQVQAQQIHHLLDDEQPLVKRVIAAQHLTAAQTVGVGSVGLDVSHGDGLPAKGMVNQKFGVDAEQVVEEVFVCFGDVPHGADAVWFQTSGGAGTDPPEIGERPVIPQLCAVAVFVQFPDKIFCVFGGDIQSDLGQIQVAAHAAGGADSGGTEDFGHDLLTQLAGGQMVKRQIVSHIHKGFVDGVDMNIFPGDILQVDAVDIGGGVDVLLHTGRGHRIPHMLRNLENAAAVPDTESLHGRGDGQTDGLLGPFRVGHDQILGHWIHAPGNTFHRSIKRFQVDTQVGALFHEKPPSSMGQ